LQRTTQPFPLSRILISVKIVQTPGRIDKRERLLNRMDTPDYIWTIWGPSYVVKVSFWECRRGKVRATYWKPRALREKERIWSSFDTSRGITYKSFREVRSPAALPGNRPKNNCLRGWLWGGTDEEEAGSAGKGSRSHLTSGLKTFISDEKRGKRT